MEVRKDGNKRALGGIFRKQSDYEATLCWDSGISGIESGKC